MKDRNWFTSFGKQAGSYAWCHGASGILLNRVILKAHGYEDEHLDNELEIALETTLSKGFGHNDTLCHGDLGNLDIVHFAARVLNDANLLERCAWTYSRLFETHISSHWDGGVFGKAEIYGLMVGLAGYGYSILKRGLGYRLPEILWLE